MSTEIRLHFSLVLIGIFLSNLLSAKSIYRSSSIDTLKHVSTWFDKNDTIQFFPVCGANGKTYTNPDEASFYGVDAWTEGPCNAYEEVLSIEPNTFWIEEISLNGVTNSSDSNAIGYSDYTNIILEIYKNKENKFSYKSNAHHEKAESEISIWIDFNKNGSFEEFEILEKENITSKDGNFTFLIPSSIKTFLMTRMRIVCSSQNDYPVSGFLSKGEVEDYTIIVIE